MKRITILTALIAFLAIGCTEEASCYKCELISQNGRFSTTEYLPCSTDVEHFKDWVYSRGKVKLILCEEL